MDGHPAGERDAELRAGLRRAVFGLRSTERRRIFPPAVHVGPLDCPASLVLDDDLRLDHGLRVDVGATLLAGNDATQESGAWLTRVGHPEPHDLDAAWMGPLAAAFAEQGRLPAFLVVITKQGWYEPRGERRATWQRLRIRRPGSC